jgi:hypothetical protein
MLLETKLYLAYILVIGNSEQVGKIRQKANIRRFYDSHLPPAWTAACAPSKNFRHLQQNFSAEIKSSHQ